MTALIKYYYYVINSCDVPIFLFIRVRRNADIFISLQIRNENDWAGDAFQQIVRYERLITPNEKDIQSHYKIDRGPPAVSVASSGEKLYRSFLSQN